MDQTLGALRGRLAKITTNKAVCPVQRLYESLDEETAKTLRSLIDNPDIPTTRIHQELRVAGISIAKDSISWHRRHICSCYVGVEDE